MQRGDDCLVRGVDTKALQNIRVRLINLIPEPIRENNLSERGVLVRQHGGWRLRPACPAPDDPAW